MLRRFSINFAVLSMVIDGLFVMLSMWTAVQIRPLLNDLGFVAPIPSPVFLPARLYLLFPLTWLSIFAAFAIYDGRKFLRVADEFTAISLASFLASISCAGILYFSFRDVSRVLFGLIVLTTYCLILAWRVLARYYFRARSDGPEKTRRILIVGTGKLGEKVRAQLAENRVENLSLVGFLDDSVSLLKPSTNVLGGRDNICDVVTDSQISDIIMAMPHSRYQNMGSIVSQLDEMPVKVWIALGFFDLALYKAEIEDFAGIPMLDLRAAALSDYQLLVKRGFDLFFGILALLLVVPLMGLIVLVILVDDGRPVLLFQKRVGENGRLFDMYKFRTMVKDAANLRELVEHEDENGEFIHKTANDPRVTLSGRFLRRFSLDELPQFINVVLGTMSLVGPRPEMPYMVEKYHPWQRKRFAAPPGLTGWWQVNGRSEKPMHLNTEDDLYYIQNYSLWLDIQILVRTVWTVLLGRGAY